MTVISEALGVLAFIAATLMLAGVFWLIAVCIGERERKRAREAKFAADVREFTRRQVELHQLEALYAAEPYDHESEGL